MVKNIPVKLPFSNFSHVGVVVRDMEKTLKRLEALNLGQVKPLSLPPMIGDLMFRGQVLHSKQDVFIVKAGNIELELFQPLEGKSPWMEFLNSKGEGIHHMAFASDNVDQDVAVLTGKGATIIHNGKWEGGGFAYLDMGTGNIIIEMIQL